jgi:hypothetical protein
VQLLLRQVLDAAEAGSVHPEEIDGRGAGEPVQQIGAVTRARRCASLMTTAPRGSSPV